MEDTSWSPGLCSAGSGVFVFETAPSFVGLAGRSAGERFWAALGGDALAGEAERRGGDEASFVCCEWSSGTWAVTWAGEELGETGFLLDGDSDESSLNGDDMSLAFSGD